MPNEDQKAAEGKRGGSGVILKILPYILILVLGAIGGVYLAQQKPEWFGLSKGNVAVQAEVDTLIAQVGKLISLPTDEKPTVATVTDATKLAGQPFFAKAKNDDKVLIYQKAAKAILYRPSENRIIEVGAVNIGGQVAPSPSPSASPSPSGKGKATPTPAATP